MNNERWPVWKLGVLLYPFTAAAVAINIFLFFLMLQAIGVPALSPWGSMVGGAVFGVPATWAAGKWVRNLMDEADS